MKNIDFLYNKRTLHIDYTIQDDKQVFLFAVQIFIYQLTNASKWNMIITISNTVKRKSTSFAVAKRAVGWWKTAEANDRTGL